MSTTEPQFFLPDALLDQAIEDFTFENQRALDRYLDIPVRQRTPDERQAIAELRRDIGAYRRVADYMAAGLYPTCLDALWEIDSLSERGTKHHIWKSGGRWACDCKCADRGYFHVHQAWMAVIERAMELAEQYGAAVPAEPDIDPYLPPAPAAVRSLVSRLCAAREARWAA